MAKIAPMKNVLSPISILRIMILVLEKPANQLLDFSLDGLLICTYIYKKRYTRNILKFAHSVCVKGWKKPP